MATSMQYLPWDNYTLANFKQWAQAIGTVMTGFGWTLDTTVNGTVNWSTLTNFPAQFGFTNTTLPTVGTTTFKGAFNNTSTYAVNDYVTFNGATWVCNTAYTSTASTPTPGNDIGSGLTQHWSLWCFEIYESVVTPTMYIRFEYYGFASTSVAQIQPLIRVVIGTSDTETPFTLTSVANASGGTTVYTGTITGGAANAFAGYTFVIAGFTTSANNGTFTCSASTATTLTLSNASGVAETHAATATYSNANLGSGTGNVRTSGFVMNNSQVSVGDIVYGNNYPCYFSGDNGNRLAFLMWDDVDNSQGASFFCVERSLSNAGAYYTTPSGAVTPYWTIISHSYSNTSTSQALVNTTGSTWVATTQDSVPWVLNANLQHNVNPEAIGTQTGAGIGNGSFPAMPLFPMVGWVGNPMTAAMSFKLSDAPHNGEYTIALYGTTHTYYCTRNNVFSTFGGAGSGNNGLAIRFE